jgi:methionyl-tRNA formyltransferase
LLPKYRGAAPANWAIVNGEKQSGVTTMFIEPSLDTGPILLQRATQIGETETAPELMQRLSEMGAELLSETLSRLDEITPQPQDDEQATFAPILKKEDGLVDWSLLAKAVESGVRGFQPWPTAYTSFNSRRLTIWRAESLASTNSQAHPGEVISAHGDDLIVQCGQATALRLLEVQPESRKRMTVREFLAGRQLELGDLLGKA